MFEPISEKAATPAGPKEGHRETGDDRAGPYEAWHLLFAVVISLEPAPV